MGKRFTKLVSVLSSTELEKEINKTLEELGNPKVIGIDVFESELDPVDFLHALLVLEEE